MSKKTVGSSYQLSINTCSCSVSEIKMFSLSHKLKTKQQQKKQKAQTWSFFYDGKLFDSDAGGFGNVLAITSLVIVTV